MPAGVTTEGTNGHGFLVICKQCRRETWWLDKDVALRDAIGHNHSKHKENA